METIYNRIEKRRKELGISQEELAGLVGYKEKSRMLHSIFRGLRVSLLYNYCILAIKKGLRRGP